MTLCGERSRTTFYQIHRNGASTRNRERPYTIPAVFLKM